MHMQFNPCSCLNSILIIQRVYLIRSGHCTEFNIVGGVIQDQHSAPCSVTFPKCDKYYTSNDAYKCKNSYFVSSLPDLIWRLSVRL